MVHYVAFESSWQNYQLSFRPDVKCSTEDVINPAQSLTFQILFRFATVRDLDLSCLSADPLQMIRNPS